MFKWYLTPAPQTGILRSLTSVPPHSAASVVTSQEEFPVEDSLQMEYGG